MNVCQRLMRLGDRLRGTGPVYLNIILPELPILPSIRDTPMNKFLASASFIVLSSVTAFAADLPVSYKSPAPAIVPTYTWTGCYIGAHGGGGLMNDSNSNG